MFSLYASLKIIGIITLAIFTLVIAKPVTDKVGSTDYPNYEHSGIDRSRACPEGYIKDLHGNCKKGHKGPNNGNDDDFEDETENSAQIEVSTIQESHLQQESATESSTKGGSTVPELNQRILVSIVAFSLLVR